MNSALHFIVEVQRKLSTESSLAFYQAVQDGSTDERYFPRSFASSRSSMPEFSKHAEIGYE